MSDEEQAWEQIMADTKNTSKEVLEKLRCPSVGKDVSGPEGNQAIEGRCTASPLPVPPGNLNMY